MSIARHNILAWSWWRGMVDVPLRGEGEQEGKRGKGWGMAWVRARVGVGYVLVDGICGRHTRCEGGVDARFGPARCL
ncbi:hypothetical protein E2562_025907 [Oryza meyeriana var. granulata]|uniref:Uncharacterized protein n=1 Tax=Oryza meyeriana var. granulata TaxID=110450 RepID=A0A6G1CJM7_9ORYZ|nr:hypothetical protein E2562_025907 [Oryza meyeriana var. granulata]